MISVRCNDPKWESHVCNLRTHIVEQWLYEHVGRRWYEWEWDSEIGFGYVKVYDDEVAMLFKLRFGL